MQRASRLRSDRRPGIIAALRRIRSGLNSSQRNSRCEGGDTGGGDAAFVIGLPPDDLPGGLTCRGRSPPPPRKYCESRQVWTAVLRYVVSPKPGRDILPGIIRSQRTRLDIRSNRGGPRPCRWERAAGNVTSTLLSIEHFPRWSI
jgi:hypothetical protein